MLDLETLFTIIYVLVDDWYQTKGKLFLKGKPGRKAKFSDSELMTLLLAMDFVPYPSESQFLAFMRANHLELFPKLVSQSQFNRRLRALRLLVEELRKQWMRKLGVEFETYFLLDTKPLPILGYKRSKKRSDFRGSAAYGYCESRRLRYFGYKLVMITTLSGIPIAYELVPADTDDRVAANEVLDSLNNSHVYGDKGFIGEEWQTRRYELDGNRIWSAKRKNQKGQNPPAFDRLLSQVRQRLEGVFNEIQNTGRQLERLVCKKIQGVAAHVIAKVTSYTLKLLLRQVYHLDVQTFSTIS